MEKIKVGQPLYAKAEGPNSGRMSKELIEVVVQAVGKKWFTVKRADGSWQFYRSRFSLETLWQDGGNYSPEWRLYTSLQEIEDKQRRAVLVSKIEGQSFSTLSIDQLERIDAIINEK
mgnify:FL=1